MAHTVVGFFDNAAEAQEAVVKLTKYGIDRERVDVSNSSSGSSSYTTDDNRGNDYRGKDDRSNESGISRFFRNLFGDDDDDADKYSRVASRAQSIVTVHANSRDEAEQAADILDDCGAVDVDERAAKYGYSGSGINRSANYVGNSGNLDSGDYRDTDDNSTEKLDVIREDLEVGKREVERGGVRLRSRIVERPVEETVRLREERVTVNRNPVDRATTDADFSNFEERNIEMIERAEVPVVNKESRVVEEVSLNKEVEEREETIRDTVRNTEVDIENIDRDKTRDRDISLDTENRNRDRDINMNRDNDRDRDISLDSDMNRNRDRDVNMNRDNDRDRDISLDSDMNRNRDRDVNLNRDNDRDRDINLDSDMNRRRDRRDRDSFSDDVTERGI
jgi:stress response protein YsnF